MSELDTDTVCPKTLKSQIILMARSHNQTVFYSILEYLFFPWQLMNNLLARKRTVKNNESKISLNLASVQASPVWALDPVP